MPYTSESAVIIVGQRVSTIASADQIMVLEDGVAVGLGTHDDLLLTCPTYAEIVASQMSAEDARMSTDEAQHADDRTEDEPEIRPPSSELRPQAGRFSSVGVPTERSKDFKAASGKLIDRLRPERAKMLLVLVMALSSVTMVVLGPKILGHATDIIFDGLTGRNGRTSIDFGELHRVLYIVLALYVVSFVLGYMQAYVLAGAVQRTMFRLRSEVEDKLGRLPLDWVDKQQRGDLLSRATNDIDNVAQSLQQTLSQLLTSALTIVGVLIMMLLISPLLALIAVVTVPLSLLRHVAHRGALEEEVHGPMAAHR